jgi:hypothetical protein
VVREPDPQRATKNFTRPKKTLDIPGRCDIIGYRKNKENKNGGN